MIGQTSTKNKGKLARMLAAKASLATRVDALGEDGTFTLGMQHKAKLEEKLRLLEQGNVKRISGTGKAKAMFEKYHGVSQIKQYPEAADSTIASTSKRKVSETEAEPTETKTKKKKVKKEKKEAEQNAEGMFVFINVYTFRSC
nr:unnamed protein product [Callosobruchus chinensis]